MVCVNDAFYGDSGEILRALPKGVERIGAGKQTVPQNKPMIREPFTTNQCPPGCDIYRILDEPEHSYIDFITTNIMLYPVYERLD